MKVLGKVRWVNATGGSKIAGIEPLYEIDTEDWRPIDPEEFPERGFVFWPGVRDAVENQLVRFRAEQNSTGYKDHFKAADVRHELDVLDLRKYGSPTEVRRLLVRGLENTSIPEGRVLIWCDADALVGPVKLKKTASSLVLEGPSLDRIPVYIGADILIINDGKEDRMVRADDRPAAGYVDWDDDLTLLKRGIQAAVTLAQRSESAILQTKKQIEEAAELIVSKEPTPEIELIRYRVERARSICASAALSQDIAGMLAKDLLKHPSIAKLISDETESIKKQVQNQAKAEAEKSLVPLREQVAQLDVSKGELSQEIAEKQSRIAELNREL